MYNPQQPHLENSPAAGDGFISAVEASARFHITNDHIGSLCRKGQVKGRLVGRVWFVSEQSLKAYIGRQRSDKEARHKTLSETLKQQHAAHRALPLAVAPNSVFVPARRFSLAYIGLLFFCMAGLAAASTLPLQPVATVVRFMPAALAETSYAWYDASFGTAGRVFVLGVYEIGAVGAATADASLASFATALASSASQNAASAEPVATLQPLPAPLPQDFFANAAEQIAARIPQVPGVTLSQLKVAPTARMTVPPPGPDVSPASLAAALGQANIALFAPYPYLWQKISSGAGAFVADSYAARDLSALSYGTVARSFVASVYELGDASNNAAQNEFNTAAVWDAWTQWLGQALNPAPPQFGVASSAPAPAAPARVTPPPATQAPSVEKIYISSASGVVLPSPKTAPALPAPKPAVNAAYVTQDSLSAQLQTLSDSLHGLIYNANAQSTSSLYASLWGAIALTQNIDSLPSTVTINNSPIITSASVPTLSALTGLLGVGQGGTGTSTAPSYGQLLVGNSNGGYDLLATSSLGIAGGSAPALAGLTDVSLTSPVFGNLLEYSGSAWVNVATSSLGLGTPFTYPFPSGATSSLVAFNGGLTTTGATSTGTFAVTASTTIGGILNATNGGILNIGQATTSALYVTASSTIAGQFNSLFANWFASTTLSGKTLLSNATTTSFAILGSTTVSGAFNVGGAAFFGGKVGLGTTTPWATFAINPIAGQAANQFVVGSSTATSFIISNSGFTGIGTTSPFAALSIGTASSSNITPASTLFAIGSTTAAGIYSTLFSVGNTGIVSLLGTTTLSIAGTNNVWLGAGTFGSTTLALGNNDVFIGQNAGYAVTASQSIYIGSLSGMGSTTGAANSGTQNTAVGYATLRYNSTGANNAAFGGSALTANTTGGSNSAFGWGVLQNNTTGSNNTAFGGFTGAASTLGGNTTGTQNSAFGGGALGANTTGNNNNAFGYYALGSESTGNNNTAFGLQAGYSVSTGFSNTIIGDYSTSFATTLTTGFGNIGLGSNIFFPNAAGNRQLNIGNLIFGTLPATSTSFQVATGTIGIASSSPWGMFSIHANASSTLTTLFAIGSTSLSSGGVFSTSTLFSISNTGTFNYGVTATSTILNAPYAWSLATSTAAGSQPVFSVSGTGATSTISFFGATTTGLVAGVGAPVTGQNSLIIGNGAVIANVVITNGSLCVSGAGWCVASSTGGSVSARAFNTISTEDLAEDYLSSNTKLEPGNIVEAAGSASVSLAAPGDGHAVVGIVSTAPGMTLGVDPDLSVQGPLYPIALAGRVPLLVNLDNGPIATGDRIALSTTTPGVGMKARPFDGSVGIALVPYTATSTSNSIMVFVHLEQGFEVAPLGGALLAPPAAPGDYDFVGALFSALTAHLVQWFADSTNGITQFFAAELDTKKLCVADDSGAQTCITKAQLDALLAGAAAQSASPPPAASQPQSSAPAVPPAAGVAEPPTITINGANPASLNIGDTYADLGATISDMGAGQAGDSNLGYTTFVDGVMVQTISLDTSTSTTYTIDYVATDSTGLTATSTRTVTVEAAAQSQTQADSPPPEAATTTAQ